MYPKPRGDVCADELDGGGGESGVSRPSKNKWKQQKKKHVVRWFFLFFGDSWVKLTQCVNPDEKYKVEDKNGNVIISSQKK